MEELAAGAAASIEAAAAAAASLYKEEPAKRAKSAHRRPSPLVVEEEEEEARRPTKETTMHVYVYDQANLGAGVMAYIRNCRMPVVFDKTSGSFKVSIRDVIRQLMSQNLIKKKYALTGVIVTAYLDPSSMYAVSGTKHKNDDMYNIQIYM